MRTGSVDVYPSIQRTSTSSVRGPHRTSRTRAAAASAAAHAASSSGGVEVGLDRDDGVEEVVLDRAADRIGLVDRRHRGDPDARRAAARWSTASCRYAEPVTEVGADPEVRERHRVPVRRVTP